MSPDRRRAVFVAAFLAIQLALPLLWYASDRADYDARFAWRMFASQSAARCSAEATLDGRRIDLERHLAEVWRHRLRDGWGGVLSAVTVQLCARGDAEVALRCVEVGGAERTLRGPACPK